jgi:hypothetical protein
MRGKSAIGSGPMGLTLVLPVVRRHAAPAAWPNLVVDNRRLLDNSNPVVTDFRILTRRGQANGSLRRIAFVWMSRYGLEDYDRATISVRARSQDAA